MTGDSLVFRVGRRFCALALEGVGETMRPLPVESLPDVPSFVVGASIVRGAPTPIVDLRKLLGEDASAVGPRMVTLRAGSGRHVGLLVDEVLGVRSSEEWTGGDLAPLLRDAELVDELARLDGGLLTVLQAGRILPEAVWDRTFDERVDP